ncbi:MAG: phosphoglycerate kinase [Candidatus Niyogibacteria bacterium CG10_big_fil_rev_8_21_14_0_10_42_19]|uniref:Phosphoglycerate kinase n=1 Tax=Candidatus Niyogibacteria bacterium CG10_big_fil_rev_8_21_14_0_10_42_19 TaxID=1974725 RepID=A0A2H0TG30_9BACT|nr:MAG: phosphoglycerate kinase [Candidatus Niyogibacteria bacterium CG10_big_fil_rev_8_21_14_0_10_42_19]
MGFKLSLFPKKLKEKRILMRVDFNVPSRLGKVDDDFRIQKTIPAIKDLIKCGHKIILISHFEQKDKTPTLLPVAAYLKERGLKRLRFVDEVTGDKVKNAVSKMRSGDVILLENLRKDPREKNNNATFASELANLADYYINEAFSVSHREHASIVGVSKLLPSFAGPLFKEEVRRLSRSFRPPHPFLFVLGGIKPIKLLLLERFLGRADNIIIGGTMANTILYAKGVKVGESIIEKESISKIKDNILNSNKILFPSDVVVSRKGRKKTIVLKDVEKNDSIFDLGPDTMRQAEAMIKKSRFVLWNGPLGYVEGGFDGSTLQLAVALSRSKAETIVGGGDTLGFLRKENLSGKFSFISTGGGAMLEFLAYGTLPGINALQKP